MADEPLPPGALVRFGSAKFRLPQGAATLTFSPDSKQLISGDNQGTIQAWDVATGHVVHFWKMSPSTVLFMRFSPDGKKLAASYGDGGVYILDPESGKTVSPQNERRYDPTFFAWAPDSKTILLCRRDGRVQRVEPDTGRVVTTSTANLLSTAGIACAPDGKSVVLQSYDGNLRSLDLQTGKESVTFEKIPPDLRSQVRGTNTLMFTSDGKQVLGAFSNRAIPIWDAKTGKIARRFELPPGQWMYNVSLSVNGRFAAIAMQDGGLRVWGVASGEELRTLETGRINPHGMAFSPDGRLLAGVVGQTLRIWDLPSGKDLHDDAGHRGLIQSLAFLDGSSKLVTVGQDMTMRYWDAATGRELHKMRLPQYVYNTITADATDRAVLFSLNGMGMRRWAPSAAGDSEAVPVPATLQNHVFQFSADGRFAAASQNNVEFIVVDTTTGAELHRVSPAGRMGYNPLPSPGGRYLAYASNFLPGTVLVWDFAAGYGKRPLVSDGPNRGANRMAFSRDGRLLAVQYNTGAVQVWEIATGISLAQVETPDGPDIMAIALSPDARTLALANGTGAIRLFDIATGKASNAVQAHAGYVPALAFSPDGSRLASGSMDTTAVLWDVARLAESFPRVEKNPAPTDKQLEDWRNLLASTEGRTLWPAMDHLVAAPDRAVAMFREKLKPEPAPDMTQVGRWITELDNPRFNVRDKATRGLAALGGRVAPALAAALQAGPTPEAKRRLEGLLQTLRDGISITQLRPLRSIEVLERINTHESRQVLEAFANQTGEFELKREAEFALKRMAK
jgi:WD40 repeat protein